MEITQRPPTIVRLARGQVIRIATEQCALQLRTGAPPRDCQRTTLGRLAAAIDARTAATNRLAHQLGDGAP